MTIEYDESEVMYEGWPPLGAKIFSSLCRDTVEKSDKKIKFFFIKGNGVINLQQVYMILTSCFDQNRPSLMLFILKNLPEKIIDLYKIKIFLTASFFGYIDLVKFIIPKIDQKEIGKGMMLASDNNQKEILAFLIDKADRGFSDTLFKAILFGNIEAVKKLIPKILENGHEEYIFEAYQLILFILHDNKKYLSGLLFKHFKEEIKDEVYQSILRILLEYFPEEEMLKKISSLKGTSFENEGEVITTIPKALSCIFPFKENEVFPVNKPEGIEHLLMCKTFFEDITIS